MRQGMSGPLHLAHANTLRLKGPLEIVKKINNAKVFEI